jgi:hypothetical protein
MMALHCALLSVVLLLGSTGCSVRQNVDRAESEAVQFHKLIESGDIHKIYSEADSELKAATSEVEFSELLISVGKKLGPLQSLKRLNANVNYTAAGTIATLRFNSQFDKGQAIEEFSYRITTNVCYLVSYHITSNALIKN